MYRLSIEILFCIVASIISTEFYVAFSCKKAPKITMMLMIFATHLVIILPFYNKFESWLDIAQIVAEFIIIIMIVDGKILQKLVMYVELNVAFGVASIVAYSFKESKMMYCLLTLIIAGTICYSFIRLNHRKQKNINNLNGKVLSLAMCMAMLCCMYTIGVVIGNLTAKRMMIIYICFLLIITLVYELLIINEKIRRNEITGRSHFVIRKIHEKSDILADKLYREAVTENDNLKKAREKLGYLYANLSESGRLREILLEQKLNKAKTCGCKLEIIGNATDNFEHMPAFEYVTITANLMDNAIEAASQNSCDNRWIRVCMSEDEFTISNPYKTALKKQGELYGTTKNESGYGLGLLNVKEMSKAAGKKMDISTEDGIFKVCIKS